MCARASRTVDAADNDWRRHSASVRSRDLRSALRRPSTRARDGRSRRQHRARGTRSDEPARTVSPATARARTWRAASHPRGSSVLAVAEQDQVCHPAEPANNCAVVRHKAPASIILLRPSGPGIRESASIVPNAPRSPSAVSPGSGDSKPPRRTSCDIVSRVMLQFVEQINSDNYHQ